MISRSSAGPYTAKGAISDPKSTLFYERRFSMRHRQHAVLAFAILALAGGLAAAAPTPAAELTGPGTLALAVPSACAAPTLQLALPALLTPASAAAEPLALPPLFAAHCQFQCLPMGC